MKTFVKNIYPIRKSIDLMVVVLVFIISIGIFSFASLDAFADQTIPAPQPAVPQPYAEPTTPPVTTPPPPITPAADFARFIVTRPTPAVFGAASDITITGTLPHVAIPQNPPVAAAFNEHFSRQFQAFVAAHAGTALVMNFETQILVSEPFVSIVTTMEARAISSTFTIATTVIDARNGAILTLGDIHPNITRLFNSRIRTMIAGQPRNFIANFAGLGETQSFSIYNNILTIHFGSAELIPAYRGVFSLSLNLANVRHETLAPPVHIHILPPTQYSTVMINLNEVATRFGYTIANAAGRITVTRDTFTTAFTIGQNSYTTIRGNVRELENAPMIVGGSVFVPLSFMDDVLGIAATVLGDNIVLSMYLQTQDEPS